jgi:hypothetical protein
LFARTQTCFRPSMRFACPEENDLLAAERIGRNRTLYAVPWGAPYL